MVDLGLQRGDCEVGKAIHQREPQLGVRLHHHFGVVIRARRPAFDEVAGNGEWRSGKADEWDVEFGHQVVDGFEHVGRVGFGVERAKPRQVVARSEWLFDHWADAGNDVHTEPDCVHRRDDVGVEDRCINAVAADGLHRDLGR